MYIDDLTVGEVHDLNTARIHITEQKETKLVHAMQCEQSFKTITVNAKNIGMKINDAKTQLICISDNPNAVVSSYIDIAEDTRISLSLIHI